ncbi:MAG: RrF2 family transcriptional regulator [Chloroflexota bacterium]
MQITRRADYAVRTMLQVAESDGGSTVLTQEVASRQGIPGPFLAKIVLALTRGGLLRSRRGTGGGIVLARPADQITLLQIVEAVDGPIAVNSCVLWPDECARVGICPVHEIWCEAQSLLADRLRGTTVADLARRGRELHCLDTG